MSRATPHRRALCCLALAAMPALAADVQVELRPQAAARGAQVVLGDVAWVRGNEYEAVARLVRLPIGHAPRAGTDARLSRESLLRWTRSQLGGLAERVEWSGAQEVLVSRAAPEASAAAVPGAGRDAAQVAATAPAAPAVARGEWVTLVARSAGLELESPAEVLQDARLGEPVRVRSASASGSVVARVVAPGRVEISP